MEPKREAGDDRVIWKVRPLMMPPNVHESRVRIPSGPWAIMECGADVIDTIEGCDLNSSYEIMQVVITAEEWNEMPEFEGW